MNQLLMAKNWKLWQMITGCLTKNKDNNNRRWFTLMWQNLDGFCYLCQALTAYDLHKSGKKMFMFSNLITNSNSHFSIVYGRPNFYMCDVHMSSIPGQMKALCWAGYVAQVRENRSSWRVLMGKPKGKRCTCIWEDDDDDDNNNNNNNKQKLKVK